MATTFSTGAAPAPAPARFAVAVMAVSRADGPVDGQLSLLSGRECIGEGALPRRALLHRQNGAAIVVIDHGDVELAALLQQLKIALLVRVYVRQTDLIEAVSDPHREPGEATAGVSGGKMVASLAASIDLPAP